MWQILENQISYQSSQNSTATKYCSTLSMGNYIGRQYNPYSYSLFFQNHPIVSNINWYHCQRSSHYLSRPYIQTPWHFTKGDLRLRTSICLIIYGCSLHPVTYTRKSIYYDNRSSTNSMNLYIKMPYALWLQTDEQYKHKLHEDTNSQKRALVNLNLWLLW